MSSVTNILKCVSHLQRLDQELESIAKQVTAEAQLAQDAQSREAEIQEETCLFLERLGGQRKRSGSANTEATSSRKTMAISAVQGGGQVRVLASPEKPEVTTKASAEVACQGPSGEGNASALPAHHNTTVPQVAAFIQRVQENREQELVSRLAETCAESMEPETTFMPRPAEGLTAGRPVAKPGSKNSSKLEQFARWMVPSGTNN